MYSTDSAVTENNNANSEGTIQTFAQENQVNQQNFNQEVQMEVMWLQVGCAILYLDNECTNSPKIYKKTQNSIARNVT
jgi:hypothetical protein